VHEVLEFWKLARKHPLTAILILLVTMAVTLIWRPIQVRLMKLIEPPPFAHLQGLYSGKTQGHDIKVCLKTFGNSVWGMVQWDNDKENQNYVLLEGTILPDRVKLEYRRNPNTRDSDKGIAVISERGKKRYGGFWSSTDRKNGEEWLLIKVQDKCDLIWGGGLTPR